MELIVARNNASKRKEAAIRDKLDQVIKQVLGREEARVQKQISEDFFMLARERGRGSLVLSREVYNQLIREKMSGGVMG